MAGQDNLYNQGGKKRSFSRKASKNRAAFEQDHGSENQSGGLTDETFKNRNYSKYQGASVPHTFKVLKIGNRKSIGEVDPETAKCFSEIANVIEGTDVDFEERLAMCGNALEETRGKEVELATDYIISHTLQTLLDGCSVDHLCWFLRSCSKDFPHIASDRSGSHVAETTLKALAMHLQDNETYSLVEETLTTICQVIVVNPVDVMCNCHGSHVLRSLLCLCKGVPLDSSEFHSTKSSTVLAERLNFKPPQTVPLRLMILLFHCRYVYWEPSSSRGKSKEVLEIMIYIVGPLLNSLSFWGRWFLTWYQRSGCVQSLEFVTCCLHLFPSCSMHQHVRGSVGNHDIYC